MNILYDLIHTLWYICIKNETCFTLDTISISSIYVYLKLHALSSEESGMLLSIFISLLFLHASREHYIH